MLTRFRFDKISRLEDLPVLVSAYLKKLPQTIEPIGTPLTILRYEFPSESINILQWLNHQPAKTKIYWSDRNEKIEIGGTGSADIIQGNGSINHEEVFNHIEDRLASDNPGLRYYGGYCFDDQHIDPAWSDFGTYQFMIPKFEFYRQVNDYHFAVNIAVKDIKAEFIKNLIDQLNQCDFKPTQTVYSIPDIKNRIDQPDQKEWPKIFGSAQQLLKSGKLQKIVLARKSTFTFSEHLNPWELFIQLKKDTPKCFHFCFQLDVDSVFLGASPERLYKKTLHHFETEALAGTMPRSENPVKDKQLGKDLLQSAKNLVEHKLVVNSIKAKAENLTQKLNGNLNPQLLTLHAGHHLMTRFEGTLKDRVNDADILQHMHPTPAVAGHPIEDSIQCLRQLESFSRGWYAGPIGYVGFDQTEFAVGIRSALLKNNQLSLFAGAGIVDESTLSNEWNEIENKVSTFLKIFNNAHEVYRQ